MLRKVTLRHQYDGLESVGGGPKHFQWQIQMLRRSPNGSELTGKANLKTPQEPIYLSELCTEQEYFTNSQLLFLLAVSCCQALRLFLVRRLLDKSFDILGVDGRRQSGNACDI
jgi:hypothetical protein